MRISFLSAKNLPNALTPWPFFIESRIFLLGFLRQRMFGCQLENDGKGRKKFKAASEFDSQHDFVALLDLKWSEHVRLKQDG
jgi:hypothetical protein